MATKHGSTLPRYTLGPDGVKSDINGEWVLQSDVQDLLDILEQAWEFLRAQHADAVTRAKDAAERWASVQEDLNRTRFEILRLETKQAVLLRQLDEASAKLIAAQSLMTPEQIRQAKSRAAEILA